MSSSRLGDEGTIGKMTVQDKLSGTRHGNQFAKVLFKTSVCLSICFVITVSLLGSEMFDQSTCLLPALLHCPFLS